MAGFVEFSQLRETTRSKPVLFAWLTQMEAEQEPSRTVPIPIANLHKRRSQGNMRRTTAALAQGGGAAWWVAQRPRGRIPPPCAALARAGEANARAGGRSLSLSAPASGDVLIVGAGPVGVYLSILLARLGVSSVVIDQTDAGGAAERGRAPHPRAHVLHTRSMELMREIGLAADIEREMPPIEQWRHFRYCTALVGAELAAVDHCDNSDGASANLRGNSAAFVAHLSQPTLEGMLWRKARESPAAQHVCFLPRHRLERLRVHADHVEAGILRVDGQDGASHASATPAHRPGSPSMRFRYVVGADGARSEVRRMCGIQLQGRRGIESFISIHFECPALWQRMDARGAMLYFIFNPQVEHRGVRGRAWGARVAGCGADGHDARCQGSNRRTRKHAHQRTHIHTHRV